MTTLHAFQGPDGLYPSGGLVEGADGNFYGTTYGGGAHNDAICQGYGCGTIFKITPGGEFTTIHSFCSYPHCADGYWPTSYFNITSAFVLGSDGNLYGLTQCGAAVKGTGICGYGTIFKIMPRGYLTTVHTFDGSDGDGLYATLTQGTDGNFYGTSFSGGEYQTAMGPPTGTAFRLSLGLPPIVKTLPTSGAAGTTVMILGNNLTGTSSVSFGGTEAAFTVVSDTEIQATVPERIGGPAAVPVVVTTPTGVLQSNVPFRLALTGWLQ
jgi:uncharacterized repeat protein (TIGR03803 family)